jgi:hypothetical protein
LAIYDPKVKNRPKATAQPTVRSLLEEIERARYRERALEAALVRRIESLAAAEAKAESKIRRMERSLSWRITKPVRLLRKILSRGKQLTRAAKHPIRRRD